MVFLHCLLLSFWFSSLGFFSFLFYPCQFHRQRLIFMFISAASPRKKRCSPALNRLDTASDSKSAAKGSPIELNHAPARKRATRAGVIHGAITVGRMSAARTGTCSRPRRRRWSRPSPPAPTTQQTRHAGPSSNACATKPRSSTTRSAPKFPSGPNSSNHPRLQRPRMRPRWWQW